MIIFYNCDKYKVHCNASCCETRTADYLLGNKPLKINETFINILKYKHLSTNYTYTINASSVVHSYVYAHIVGHENEINMHIQKITLYFKHKILQRGKISFVSAATLASKCFWIKISKAKSKLAEFSGLRESRSGTNGESGENQYFSQCM